MKGREIMKEVVFLSEGCEAMLAIGYKTKREAFKAIHKYERKQDPGLSKADLWRNGLKRVAVYRYKKDGDDWYDWSGEQKECPSCGAKRKGLIGYIGFI
jgi:ribonucleotide reductase alpha subunit